MPCRQPTTRPSAPCAWPSSPGASASEREPRKAAPPTPPPCPLSKPAEGAASIPGHTSPTLSPAPERTCITSRFLSQFEREGGERLRAEIEFLNSLRLVGHHPLLGKRTGAWMLPSVSASPAVAISPCWGERRRSS